MNKLIVSVALALTSSSCAPPCQEFYSLSSDVSFAKLGLGQPHSLVIGGGEGPLRVTGLPPGMSVSASGKIRLTGTPTEVGTFDLEVRPEATACEFSGSRLGNLVVNLEVVPPECDNAVACRLLKTGPCTQSSGCTPTPPYAAAACIHTIGDAGVCIDVNGPGDLCGGSLSASALTTVEGAQVVSCIGTPAITGCNYNVCAGAP